MLFFMFIKRFFNYSSYPSQRISESGFGSEVLPPPIRSRKASEQRVRDRQFRRGRIDSRKTGKVESRFDRIQPAESAVESVESSWRKIELQQFSQFRKLASQLW